MQLHLTPYEPRHSPLVFDAVRESIAEISRWMSWCHPDYALSEAEAWTQASIEAYRNETAFEFLIESPTGRVLGCCGLNQIDAQNRRCNLGYWVRSSETGRGVASWAARALADWAFRSTDLVRLEIVAATGNVASQRVAEKSGAHREAILRSRLRVQDRFHDAVLYSIVRPDALEA